MGKRDLFTKVLALLGTVLVWIPLLLPVFFSTILLVTDGIFRFDFLIPAETFFVFLAGGAFLVWAAFRSRSFRRLMPWSFAATVVLLVSANWTAVLTGIASGAQEANGWRLVLPMSIYGLCLAAMVTQAVAGILLLKRLFTKQVE